MKTPKSTTVIPVATPKAKQKAAPKKNSATPPPEKEPVVAKTKVDEPIAATPKKPTAPKKPKAASPVVPDLSLSERIGLTAGSIWQYLSENGATPITKLITALAEEEKIIQRSIGWLAQEGKITINTVDRIETIALKD